MACTSSQEDASAEGPRLIYSTKMDSSRIDSFGGDGTAKSRVGMTKDSTSMGTPPEKN